MNNTASVRWAKTGYIILSLGLCVFGVAFALRPELSLELITNITGIILIIFGAVRLWGHFSRDLYRLAFQHALVSGILAVAVGIILLVRSEVVVSILCVILGIMALADGLTKVEMSIEAKDFGLETWGLILGVGLVTGVVGFLLILRPWEGAQTMVTLLGVALFVEGVLNLITALTAVKVHTGPTPGTFDHGSLWDL